MENNQQIINTILGDQKKFKRFFLLASAILVIILIAFFGLLYHQSKTNSDIKIDFTKTGATLIINNNEQIAAQFLLPSCSRWTNTGIKLNPNSIIEFTASGKINLAAHRLIEAAEKKEMPPFNWISPKGESFKNKRPRDVYRRNFLIKPEAPMGVIIACFQKAGEPDPSIQNQRPKELSTIYEHTEIETPPYESTLWLIVNDVLLDPSRIEESEKAYYGPKEKLEKKDKLKKDSIWNYIISKDYWDIWYDDNIGNYLIQLKIKENK